MRREQPENKPPFSLARHTFKKKKETWQISVKTSNLFPINVLSLRIRCWLEKMSASRGEVVSRPEPGVQLHTRIPDTLFFSPNKQRINRLLERGAESLQMFICVSVRRLTERLRKSCDQYRAAHLRGGGRLIKWCRVPPLYVGCFLRAHHRDSGIRFLGWRPKFQDKVWTEVRFGHTSTSPRE